MQSGGVSSYKLMHSILCINILFWLLVLLFCKQVSQTLLNLPPMELEILPYI